MIRFALALELMALSLIATPQAGAQRGEAAASFEAMKGLVGTWRRADSPGSPLRIRFSLTAGGTVLTEEWTRDGQPHSLTVYHRDGSELLATHYCPQGNQPRLSMVPRTDAAVLRFGFRDATDLDATGESHVVALSFDLTSGRTLRRHETYRHDGADESSELVLVREP